MNILAIESSCDETAVAIIENGIKILSNVVASSTKMHEKYGGIVPEVASRQQLAYILPVLKEALLPFGDDNKKAIENTIDAIAVTVGPGLVGSLLIGVETAKTLSFVTGKPIIPVNHVLAHIYANFLDSQDTIKFPAIALVVSGGHTELYLMKSEKDLKWLGGTIDDAAGEAFDKSARLLGFGHGGGLSIQKAALTYQKEKNDNIIALPRPMMHDKSFNFSFSGLKTAILREVQSLQKKETLSPLVIAHLSYEIEEAITDVLVAKTMHAATEHNASSILLGGGVASNIRLRDKFQMRNEELGTKNQLFFPLFSLCTDNAAYIGSYAFFRGKPIDWHDIDVTPDLSVEVSE